MSKNGRPPTDTEALTVRMARNMIDALDAVRRDLPELPTRAEVIRQAVERDLRSRGYLKSDGIPG